MNNIQYLNIYQFYMPYYTHSHVYWDSIYNHLYPNHSILFTHTDIHLDLIFAMNYTQF